MTLHLNFPQVPPPTVTIASSTIAARSAVTLTCTVELSPSVDVPVTVTTMWAGPARIMATTTAQPVKGTYTSTATIGSFERDQSGNYSCTATLSSTILLINSSMASASTRVSVGRIA